MKKHKINERKRNLAILLVILLILGAFPSYSMGISHAEYEMADGTVDFISAGDGSIDGNDSTGTGDDNTADEDSVSDGNNGTDDGEDNVQQEITSTTKGELSKIKFSSSVKKISANKISVYYSNKPATVEVYLRTKKGELLDNASITFIRQVGDETEEHTEVIPQNSEEIATYTIPQEESEVLDWKGSVEIRDGGGKSDTYNVVIENILPGMEISESRNLIVSDKNKQDNIYIRGNNVYTTKSQLYVHAFDESGINQVWLDETKKNNPISIKTNDPIQEFTIKIQDNAGNELVETKTFYKDESAPQIKCFQIPVEAEVDQTAFAVDEENYSYEYCFHQDTAIRIYASDNKDIYRGCGVRDISFYTVNSDGVRSKSETQEAKYDPEQDSYYIETIIKDGFKGQIFAYASDFLGNVSQSEVCSQGVIVESQKKHDNADENHIEIKLPNTSYKDAKGQNLYAGKIDVLVTTADEMCGISSIGWNVDVPQDNSNNQSGRWELSGLTGSDISVGDNAGGWEVKEMDRNLVTKLQKKISISGDSNDIAISVEMTDCAGNTTEIQKVISIDQTKPVISVTFDNNESDPDYPQMYNRERTATITVKERNFSGSNMTVEVTNSSGYIPQLSEWTTKEDKDHPNNTVSTATVTFSEDGDYTFSIGGYDKVQNKADTVNVDGFTIDRTSPVISVSFDNNNVQNGNYYAAARTASISITEHNFASERVKVIGNISDTDAGTNFPAISGWSRNGDTYTATLLCDMEAKYQFDVEYSDQAGNVGTKYSSEIYYIDKTVPVIEITGVENYSANNGDVIPVVSITDRNFDEKAVSIQLTGANHGATKYKGNFTQRENGQVFTFENFPKVSEYDDLYTIDVNVKDLAGNETTEKITFSVNRFGSVYVFDSDLAKMDGKYISTEQSVKLTEINVDSLKNSSINIVVDANGVPRDLTEGEDYTVQQSGRNSGWYCYDYDIQKSVFASDGRYIVTVYSEDRAGNRNQNTEESKKAEIRFGVDKTAPIVTPINVESNRQYSVEEKQATITVNDNLVLDNVVIYVDGRESDYTVEGENYIFSIPQADRNQTISVVATDMAGNVNNYMINNVLVSTNLLAKWYYNKKLFIFSIIFLLMTIGCGTGVLALSRKRRTRAISGLFLLPMMAAVCIGMSAHAEEADSVQQKETSVLQMVVLYTDKEGNEHPVQGGTGFLIGTESASAEYMITAKEVTSVSKETEQQLIELYEDPEKTTQLSYSIKAVVKRDVMIDVQLVAESDEMGFAVWKLGQPLYDRQALILCDESLTGVSGQRATVLGFPTAPSLTGETVYYSMDEMISKEGRLIGDGIEENIKYLYHNITPNQGMIGGPILNETGNVIALNQSRQAQEGYYALQMSELLPVLEALGIPYVTTSEVEAQRLAELAAIVHKEDLQSGILAAEALEGGRYYKKSYAALRESLDEAVRVNGSETATQEEVDTALAHINIAMAELKEKPPIWVILLIVLTITIAVTVLFVFWWKKTKPQREQKKQKKLEEFTVTQAAPKFEEQAAPKEDYRTLVKSDRQDMYQTVQTGPRREDDVYGETTVFEQDTDSNAQYAYLIRKRTGEKIIIKGREFVMGKDPSQTDYCITGNSAISRVHVVILSTGLGYDVSDKNATNGTFVNGVKVAAYQKTSLKQGDILRLADEDFEFQLSVEG